MTTADLYDHVKKGRARAGRAPWGSHHLGAATKTKNMAGAVGPKVGAVGPKAGAAAAAAPKAGAKVGAEARGKSLGGVGAKVGGGGCKLPPYLAMIRGAIKELGERGGSSRQAVTKNILAR